MLVVIAMVAFATAVTAEEPFQKSHDAHPSFDTAQPPAGYVDHVAAMQRSTVMTLEIEIAEALASR